jgi:hypothetical protein
MTSDNWNQGNMADQACVAIGINRYQFLPPLSYGQADARGLRQFLVNQADLPPDQCLLLTDTSPLVGNQSTYPTQENIWQFLQANHSASDESQNWRWFFFSGYGVSWDGADYLLPIDANPKNIPGTGIPARSLLATLQNGTDEKLLVILDINRSSGLQAGAPVGAELVDLAQEMGITLLLSSQLNQFSHEAAALGQGLFTTAFLEALRYYQNDLTLERLERYLHERLPELSQHHWRPVQTPLLVTPSYINRQELILPTAFPVPMDESNIDETPIAVFPNTTWEAQQGYEENFPNGTVTTEQKSPISVVETPPQTPLIPTTIEESGRETSSPSALVPYPHPQSESDAHGGPWWQQLLLWGGGAVLLLALMILAVFLRNRDAFTPPSALETSTQPEVPNSVSNISQKPSPSPGKTMATAPQTSASSRLKANQAALARAKGLIRPNQASLFNKAIVEARAVQPGDPLYPQAQQDIQRWSGVILDLAEGRASAKNYGAAIAAAKLVPKDDPSLYSKAQQLINQWQVLGTQSQQNQTIIQSAQAQIQPDQASSYNRGINILRQVLPGQPGYDQAQALIQEWSRTIYEIAQARASKGRIQEAIQAASLVPNGTSAAQVAKDAIAKWQKQR